MEPFRPRRTCGRVATGYGREICYERLACISGTRGANLRHGCNALRRCYERPGQPQEHSIEAQGYQLRVFPR